MRKCFVPSVDQVDKNSGAEKEAAAAPKREARLLSIAAQRQKQHQQQEKRESRERSRQDARPTPRASRGE